MSCFFPVSYTHLDVYKRQAIANDFYVDDLMTGSDNPNILSKMKSDIINLLSRYGFTLRKWFSNDQTLMASCAHVSHDFSKNQNVRKLGIQWNVNEDSFLYNVQRNVNVAVVNERSAVSYTHLDVYKRQVYVIVSNVLGYMTINSSCIISSFIKITSIIHLLCA